MSRLVQNMCQVNYIVGSMKFELIYSYTKKKFKHIFTIYEIFGTGGCLIRKKIHKLESEARLNNVSSNYTQKRNWNTLFTLYEKFGTGGSLIRTKFQNRHRRLLTVMKYPPPPQVDR